MEFFMTEDFMICLLTGAVIGLLASLLIKGKGLGLIGSLVVGLIGGVIGGWAVDLLDFMNIGDLADPIIAGAAGAVILLALARMIWR